MTETVPPPMENSSINLPGTATGGGFVNYSILNKNYMFVVVFLPEYPMQLTLLLVYDFIINCFVMIYFVCILRYVVSAYCTPDFAETI